MNETGPMPSFCLFHIGMSMRLTQTTEAGIITVDSVGTVVGVDFHIDEPGQHKEALELLRVPVVILRHLPTAIYLRLDSTEDVRAVRLISSVPCEAHAEQGCVASCSECRCCDGVVAVTPFTNRSPWAIDVKLDGGQIAKAKVRRRQLPLVAAKASTLHVLQGCTCDPGLIFHWTFPSRLPKDLVWLAVYVALSRVRELKRLRSIGLSPKIRSIIEGGPPATIPAQFAQYFAKKEAATQLDADAAMEKLGWS